MSTIWSSLGKARLEELVGAQLLSRLEGLLPALRPGELEIDTIYSSDGLCRIFNAFSGAASLEHPSFRTELFNSLPPEILDEIVRRTGVCSVRLPFDQKVTRLVKAGWKTKEFAEHVVSTLGISPDFVPMDLSLPPAEQLLRAIEKPYKPLKDYQSSILYRALEDLKPTFSRFVLQMPTGSGKTRTAIEIICNFLNTASEGVISLWLVHSEELCEQAYDCFVEVWPHVGMKSLRLVRCWGDGCTLPFEFAESAFIVGSFQRLYAILQKNELPFRELAPRLELLIVDEAHKVLAPTYRAVVKALLGNTTRVIGLTATPGRSFTDVAQNEALAEFFFNKILSIDSGGRPIIDYLRTKGILSHSEYTPLITERNFELSAQEVRYVERFFDLPSGLLQRIGADDMRNVEIVKRLESECRAGGQIIFFACSVDHSRFICALLTFLGIRAAHVDGTTNRARRASLISDFKTSKIQVLCNYGLLSTGFDAPKTDVVFITRPTSSIVLYSQMIGRGLRGPAIGGTELCRVIDVIDNIKGFSDERSVYEYFSEYYD